MTFFIFSKFPWLKMKFPDFSLTWNIFHFPELFPWPWQPCTHERYKAYQTGFSFGRLSHAPGVGVSGTLGGLGGQNFFFFEIQPDLMCELLTWIAHAPAPFFGSPSPGALGRGQMVKYH